LRVLTLILTILVVLISLGISSSLPNDLVILTKGLGSALWNAITDPGWVAEATSGDAEDTMALRKAKGFVESRQAQLKLNPPCIFGRLN
jgi:hypothetical protein